MSSSSSFIYTLFFSLILYFFPSLITSQQPYLNNICRPNDNTTSAHGYTCNGVTKSCQSFLIYRTQPPYNKISSISSLFSTNPSQISSINNNITVNSPLATNTKVIIPITCSCSGKFYQSNTTYTVRSGDNYYLIANQTFEGLTTCKAIRTQKTSPNVVNIFPNENLTIPLRCACPTRKQLNSGIRYLISYVVYNGNAISSIATSFGADVGQTLEANQKTEEDSVIHPFTTLLVPLHHPPNGSHLEYPPYKPPSEVVSAPPSLPPAAATSSLVQSSRKKWVFFGFGVGAGGVFVSVLALILFFILPRKTTLLHTVEAEEKAAIVNNSPGTDETEELIENISRIASVKVYSFKDMQEATENFSSRNWIKGSIYKGNLNNGEQVAIKKIEGDVTKEISVLNKINHFNLIRLMGVCFSHEFWYCIYEYASNGPLSDWIYNENPDRKTLSWGMRMKVACDIATGINYLHSYTSPPLIHKDIRSNNILLNNEFRAKIAKFGMSRTVKGKEGQFTLTKHIEGRKGYMAPEYLENGVVSPMLDVYAFGVLLLEMLTGKNVALLYEGVKVHLSEVLSPVLSDDCNNNDGILNNVKDFMDSSLGEDYPAEIAHTMLVLVDRCLRKDPGSRPFMDEIERILSVTVTTSFICGSSTNCASTFSLSS